MTPLCILPVIMQKTSSAFASSVWRFSTRVSATLLVFGTCLICLCRLVSTCRALAIAACAESQCVLQAEQDFNDLVESVEAMQLGTGLNDGGHISS